MSPKMARISVVLPAPLGPKSPMNSPDRTSRFAPVITRRWDSDTSRSATEMSGLATAIAPLGRAQY